MTSRPLIYIAGPFRADTPWAIEKNVRKAETLGLSVARMGGIPIIPHTMYRFFQNSLPDAFWLEVGIEILRRCHVVAVAFPSRVRAQESRGTAEEIATALEFGLPVFYDGVYSSDPLKLWADCLQEWIADWIKRKKEHA